MLATPRPPRGARRPPPACHRSVTEVSQNVTAPPCRARHAAHARHAPPAAGRPPPAARVSLNVKETPHNVTKCHNAAAPRAPGGACSPRHARRAAPAARRPRVIGCHRTFTECHILSQNVTEPPCHTRQAAHARHATPAARRPPPDARASLNVTETSQNVVGCHKLLPMHPCSFPARFENCYVELAHTGRQRYL